MDHSGEGRNLLPNPSFEDIQDGVPIGWTLFSPRPGISPEFRSDARFVHSGERSLRLSGAGKAGVMGYAFAQVPIEAGASYELSVHLRAEDVADIHDSVWMTVAWLTEPLDEAAVTEQSLLGMKGLHITAATREGEWWRLCEQVEAPPEVVTAQVMLSLRNTPGGTAWFDDVSLRKVPSRPHRLVRLATTHPGERAMLDEAGKAKVDIVCLRELPQIVPESEDPHPTIPGKATEVLGEYARRYHMLIVASLREWDGSLRYNTAVIIGRDGELVGRYRKTHLPQTEVIEGTSPGSELPVFDTDIGRIGLQVCYDHFFPETSRILALKGAEIICTPIAGDCRVPDREPWVYNDSFEFVSRARAVDNGVFYVICQNSMRSIICDPYGNVIADSAGKNGVFYADVDLDEPRFYAWYTFRGSTEYKHMWRKERRPQLYQGLIQPDGLDQAEGGC